MIVISRVFGCSEERCFYFIFIFFGSKKLITDERLSDTAFFALSTAIF